MRSRWPILSILCVPATLLVPVIVLSSTVAGTDTRVWAFEFLTPPGGQAHTFARTAAGLVRHHDPPGVAGLVADTTGYVRDADRLLTRVARADSEVVRLAYGAATGALVSTPTLEVLRTPTSLSPLRRRPCSPNGGDVI